MTQIDFMNANGVPVVSMNAGNLGAVPAGTLQASNGSANNSPPLQLIVGANKPPEIYSYIRGMTPDNLSTQLEAFDRGMLRTVVPIWRKMARRDGHLLAVSEKRIGKLTGIDWEITPSDSSPEAARQAQYLGEMLEAIPDFSARREHLAEALKYSIAGHEIEWLPGEGPDGTLGCRLWPQNPEDFDLTGGRTRLYVGLKLIELPADKFLIHRLPIARMEASSILYVMKLITAGQWLAFGEKFGMPGILGNAPASASQADVDKFYEMLLGWANEFVAVSREGYTVTTLPASGANGTLTYPQLVEWADNENSKIWTGHTVTTDAKSGTGTLAGKGAKDQMDDLVAADARRMESTLDNSLLAPAVRFQFNQPLLAHFHLKNGDALDLAQEIEVDSALVDMGAELPAADVFTKYGWRQAEKGEPTIKKSVPLPATIPTALPAAFKTTDGLEKMRAAMGAMGQPIADLIARADGMTEEAFKTELLKLQLPSDAFTGIVHDLVAAAVAQGKAQTLAKAKAALAAEGGAGA